MAELPKGFTLISPQLPEGFTLQSAPGTAQPLPHPGQTMDAPLTDQTQVLQSDKPMLQRIKEFGQGIVQDVQGKGTEYDFEEIGPAFANRMKSGALLVPGAPSKYLDTISGLSFSAEPKNQIEVIRKSFPDARFRQDKFGNVVADNVEGQSFYVNKSGLSAQDFQELLYEGGLLGGGAAAGGRLTGSLLGRAGGIAGAGIGTGGASLVGDIIAQGAGSTQIIDPQKAAIAGAAGAAAEFGLPYALNVVRRVFNDARYVTPGSTGRPADRLTNEGRRVLSEAGVNPHIVTQDMLNAFNSLARTADDPVSAARQASAQTLPNPVTLTTGQATRSPATMALESEAKKGAFGEELSSQLMAGQAAQDAAVRGNIPSIQRLLSQGNPLVGRPGEGVADVQAGLLTQRSTARRGVNEAYDQARAGGPAWIDANAARELSDEMRQVGRNYDAAQYPALSARIAEMETLLAPPAPGTNVSRVTLDALERWRTRATTSANAAATPAERQATRALIRRYDENLEGNLRDSLLSGDPAAIDLWRNARAARRRFGQIFEEDDAVNHLTSVMNDGSQRLRVSAEEAANYLFGRSGIGAKKGLSKDIEKLRDTLGPDSQQWNALREEAFLRLTRGQNEDALFSAANYSKKFQNAMNDAPETMRTLFTQEEIGMMNQLRGVANDIYSSPAVSANANPSGTAFANRIIQAFGPIGSGAQAVVTTLLRPYVRGYQGQQARTASTGALPPRPLPQTFGLPGFGAVGVDQTRQ